MGESAATTESDRHTRLLALKLQTLVRDHVAPDAVPSLTPGSFALGAALTASWGAGPPGPPSPPGSLALARSASAWSGNLSDRHDDRGPSRAGTDAWVLIDPGRDDGSGLGAALAWATRRGAASLNVVTDRGTGILARRAELFSFPIEIWEVDGRALRRAVPADVELAPEPPADHLRFVVDIERAGATPLVEHGVVAGEVRGLEVCRVVDGNEPRLDVGVGVHDREAFAIMHAGVPTHDALANVVASVSAVRDVTVPAHPLNRLAPERFLRWRLEQEPWLVDVALVRPAPPPVARRNLTDRVPCTALGKRVDGSDVVIVCSVGVDLDVIPYAADARLAAQREAVGWPEVVGMDVLVVVPPRDLVAVTRDLNGLLRNPVSLVPLPSG